MLGRHLRTTPPCTAHSGVVDNLPGLQIMHVVRLPGRRIPGRVPERAASRAVFCRLSFVALSKLYIHSCMQVFRTGQTALEDRFDDDRAFGQVAGPVRQVQSGGGQRYDLSCAGHHPDFDKTDTSSLLAISCGGAQVPPDQVQKIEDRIETARPGTGYGMTETCGIITSVAGDFFIDKPDSAGPAMPNFEVKCVNDAGETVPVGELGDLWVRGSSVIKGYINRPEATAESITDGWLHTGDIARIDEDGFIYLVDRKKDMVLRGGENIYCVEVEAAMYHHPAIAECCVFGVPDERLGEEVGAAIYLKPGTTVTADELRAFCADRLAKFKIPTHIWISDTPFPRNASGKFLKREVRASLIEA